MFLRKIWLFTTFRLRSRIAAGGECFQHCYRAWPIDLDENIHLNNARYLGFMELGRTDWSLRTGFFKYALSRKLFAVVANTSIVYLKPIAPFQKFEVTTQIIDWNEDAAFFEHCFVSRQRVHAIGLVEARLIGKRGKVPFSEIARELGLALPPQTNDPLLDHHRAVTKSLVTRGKAKSD